ncbi:MAG: class I tRNA ligase family protein, partial [Planctomycetota bacterium]
MPKPLPNKYIPAEHEPAISARWDEANAFHANPERVKDGSAKPYTILIPPPNVTAALHLGHALNNTLQDILTRAHRMKGFETLWMPGTDHAGIATQTVVDRRLKAEGQPALADYKKIEAEGGEGRSQFIEKVQDWKDEYEATITDQLKLMGCSCDWQRQRFTMDPVCARAVREAFFRLFKDGLIYRGKRLVNWDPVTQTALADDEVEMHDVDSQFWYMKYPIVDDQGNDTGDFATVATTRPETYFGDTAVAVNPNDPDRKHLIGKSVKLPFVGRIIPIIGDDYVVMPDADSSDTKAQFASGFLKVTPAHDPNDYDIGLRHDLDQINVMAPDASISADHGWEDVGDATWALGLSREDARKQVEERFKAAGLLADKKPYTHAVGHSYRSHAIVEPYLSDQWYVRVTDDRLKGAALRAMATDQRTEASLERARSSSEGTAPSPDDGGLRFHPDRYAKTFET